jgi:uncharacterized protein YegP (UPF0339 family)
MAQRTFPSFWLYKDSRNEWRWTYHGKNGEEIAASCESYKRRVDAERGIEHMRASAASEMWLPTAVCDDA